MSNLHRLQDEANKHSPLGFTNAAPNTELVKDERGVSYYDERMKLPKAINFVDGTAAAPSTGDFDAFVLIGAGTVHASWGPGAAFGDWIRFFNSIPTGITPLDGYLCFDETSGDWMQYDGSIWAVFGGAAGATNLGTANNTSTNIDVTSSTGSDATLPAATPSLAGLMTA